MIFKYTILRSWFTCFEILIFLQGIVKNKFRTTNMDAYWTQSSYISNILVNICGQHKLFKLIKTFIHVYKCKQYIY